MQIHPRRHLLRLAVLCTAVGAATLATATVAAAGPSPIQRTVRYAIEKPVCATPTPARLSCMAMRLVDVPKGTKGAKAYRVPDVALAPNGGLTPADLAKAYGYNPASSTGGSQTVAIVDAYDDPNVLADLNAFDAQYGLPAETATSFRVVNQNGLQTPLPSSNTDWSTEISLDVDAVRAVCNKCKIVLVEADSPTTVDLATAVNAAAALGATEISNSYGGPEDPGSPDPGFVVNAYNHPGIVITASSGDEGWYDWDIANNAGGASDNAPNSPASYPNVVAVGGTHLALNADGTRSQETVWDRNGADDTVGVQFGALGASGGGCSRLYPPKPWQSGVAGYSATGCGSKRLVADVAALGDPNPGFGVYNTFDPSRVGWSQIGGTSLSAPLIAAMWALAGGSGGVAYPAESLYDHLRHVPSTLYDVRSGGNGFCGGASAASCSQAVEDLTGDGTGNPNNLADGNTNQWLGLLDCGYATDGSERTVAANKQCNATTGYDGPSGVGTPHGISALTPLAPLVSMRTPSLLKVNTTESFAATGFTDSIAGSHASSYHWTWGDGHTTVTTSATTTHKYLAKGSYTITLVAVDNHNRKSYATSRRMALGYPPSASISGRTRVHHRTSHTWTGKASDHNTGGRITKWTWKIGSKVYSTGSRLTHRFNKTGTYTIKLTVTDNSGLHITKAFRVKVVR